VYVCGNGDVLDLVVAQAEQVGLEVGNGSLRVELLDTITALALGQPKRRSTWNGPGGGWAMSSAALVFDLGATLGLGALRRFVRVDGSPLLDPVGRATSMRQPLPAPSRS
jgi:hypothetical protein